MSSGAVVAILEMSRHYSTQEALEVIIDSECEDSSLTSSEADTGEVKIPQI